MTSEDGTGAVVGVDELAELAAGTAGVLALALDLLPSLGDFDLGRGEPAPPKVGELDRCCGRERCW